MLEHLAGYRTMPWIEQRRFTLITNVNQLWQSLLRGFHREERGEGCAQGEEEWQANPSPKTAKTAQGKRSAEGNEGPVLAPEIEPLPGQAAILLRLQGINKYQ
jgi:hypothetical protein